MCGVLSGGVATWNTALDAEFAFQQLIDPSVQVVNITNPTANLTAAETAATTAQQTPQGRARLALAAALGDTPGWFTPLSPEPAPGDAAGQEANQFLWDTQVDFPFIFAFRAELEARAGGNPSWNTGVNYYAQLARSADLGEVTALYHEAGLSLTADLQKLNRAQRIAASPSAVRYLAQNIAFNGHLAMPVLTMHTTGDGLVVPENEQAYQSVVDRAGDGQMLRQIFVHRAGHCAFTPAETISAVQVLLGRLGTGRWNPGALDPATLNDQAAALGPGVQHLRRGQHGLADGAGLRPVPPGAVPAPVRPVQPVRRGPPGGGRPRGVTVAAEPGPPALAAGGPGPFLVRGGERQRGHELCRVDRAPAAGQVVARVGVVAGHAAEGVVPGGDVHDAGRGRRAG